MKLPCTGHLQATDIISLAPYYSPNIQKVGRRRQKYVVLLTMQTFYKTRQDKDNLQSQSKEPPLNNTKNIYRVL